MTEILNTYGAGQVPGITWHLIFECFSVLLAVSLLFWRKLSIALWVMGAAWCLAGLRVFHALEADSYNEILIQRILMFFVTLVHAITIPLIEIGMLTAFFCTVMIFGRMIPKTVMVRCVAVIILLLGMSFLFWHAEHKMVQSLADGFK